MAFYEVLGTAAVKRALAKTDVIDPTYISDGDKAPSNDGYALVYKKKGGSKAGGCHVVHVQVKGREDKRKRKQENTFTFKVDYDDLRTYLNQDGVIYYVVLISNNNQDSQIYYKVLLPFDIRKLLDNKKEKDTEVKVIFKRFPDDADDITMIFKQFISDRAKQAMVKSMSKLYTLEDLIRTNCGKPITIQMPNVPNPFDLKSSSWFRQDSFVYAQTDIDGVWMPLHRTEDIESFGISDLSPKVFMVNGNHHFLSISLIRRETSREIIFGKCISITFHDESSKFNLNYSYKGTLSERIRDFSFLYDLFISGKVYIVRPDGNLLLFGFDCKEIDNSKLENDVEKPLHAWRNCKKALDLAGARIDLEFESISQKDARTLESLILAFVEDKEVYAPELQVDSIAYGNLQVGNLRLKMFFEKGSENYYLLSSFFSRIPRSYGICADGDMVNKRMSHYMALEKDDFQDCANIDFIATYDDITSLPASEFYLAEVNFLILRMLSAYDDGAIFSQELRACVERLCDWLCAHNGDPIYELNRIQSAKRDRELNGDEKALLRDMIEGGCHHREDKEKLLFGAYTLLEDYDGATIHFGKLDVNTQSDIQNMPIYSLYKKGVA